MNLPLRFTGIMLSSALSWLCWFSAISACSGQNITTGDTLTVSGTCWDITTGVDLKASISAWVNGKTHKIGQSYSNGTFTIRVPSSIQALSFEVDGYPPTTVPINTSGKIDSSARFGIHLPIISPDSQQVTRTYQPVEQPTERRTIFSRKTTKVYFQVQNARTFRRLPATICFTYPGSGRTQCVEVDSTKVPSSFLFKPGEKIPFEVRATRYQTYRGTFVVGESETELQQIRLLPSINALIAAHNFTDNLKIAAFKVRNASNEIQVWGTKFVARPFQFYNLKAGEVYTFIATTADGRVVANETFRMAGAGFTFAQFHVSPPESTRLTRIESAKLTYFDSTVLYFDQSEYSLRPEVRGKLDSISGQLIKLRTTMAQLTGHTDNVGQRQLNQTLSEYRTRVVNSYLEQKGVRPSQLSSSWKGPDAPAAPNDTEVNKAKNRRVVIRFFTKR